MRRARTVALSVLAALVLIPWALAELLAAAVEHAARALRRVAWWLEWRLEIIFAIRDRPARGAPEREP